MGKKIVPKHEFLLKETHLKFGYVDTNNASITQEMCFLHINGFILESCHICMETLIICLHRNVNSSKFIKKIPPLNSTSTPPPPLMLCWDLGNPVYLSLPVPFWEQIRTSGEIKWKKKARTDMSDKVEHNGGKPLWMLLGVDHGLDSTEWWLWGNGWCCWEYHWVNKDSVHKLFKIY